MPARRGAGRALLIALLFAFAATAGAQALALNDADLTPERFPAAAQTLRHDLAHEAGRSLTRDQRTQALASIDRIETLLASDPERHADRILEEKARLDVVLTPARADGNERVCRRVRPIGSNIPQTICKTRAQLAEETAAARDQIDRAGRTGGN